MRGHNIGFKGVIWKIIPKLSFLPLLSGALKCSVNLRTIALLLVSTVNISPVLSEVTAVNLGNSSVG